MRLIYTDEAATTAREPVSVVAALIVNPDVHWFPVYEAAAGYLGPAYSKRIQTPEQTPPNNVYDFKRFSSAPK